VRPFAPFLISLFLLALPGPSAAEEMRSPVNGLSLKEDPSGGDYSFLAIGHLYGSPAKERSFRPAATVLANLDRMNGEGAVFLVTLGDNVRKADERSFALYREVFASKFAIPVFDAPGNHDLADRALYERVFGPTYYHFRYRSELFVILDSELMQTSDERQLREVIETLTKARTDASIRNIFLFSHRLVWAVGEERFRAVYEHLNSAQGYPKLEASKSRLQPVVDGLAAVKPVYWMSGDIGVPWSLPLFYDKADGPRVTYLATGIGDTKQDVFVKVEVRDAGRRVSFVPVSLSGGTVAPIESYGTEHWNDHFAKRPLSWWEKFRRAGDAR
jgi:hypothetical protein